jgi:hypothetical protein
VDDEISAGRKPPTKEAATKKRGRIAVVAADNAPAAKAPPPARKAPRKK